MKVLILGASGFLGGILYRKLKEETDFWVLGTYDESKKHNELIKLNVANLIEVKTFLEHFKADVIVWCLIEKTIRKELVYEGLPNILNNINQTCKFVFISTNNANLDDEKLVIEHNNYNIIKLGDIYDQDSSGKLDKIVSQLIEELSMI